MKSKAPKLGRIKAVTKARQVKKIFFVFDTTTDEILAVFDAKYFAISWMLRRKDHTKLDIYFVFVNDKFKRRPLMFRRTKEARDQTKPLSTKKLVPNIK